MPKQAKEVALTVSETQNVIFFLIYFLMQVFLGKREGKVVRLLKEKKCSQLLSLGGATL